MIVKFRTWQGLLLGVGIGLFGRALLPKINIRLQNNHLLSDLTGAMATGAVKVQENVKKWTDTVKEEAQDLVAEAQYEKIRREIDREIMDGASHDEENKLPLS